MLGISPQAAISRIGNALDLRERHPLLWQAVLAGKVRVWQANRICLECAHLPAAAAREVDQKLSQAAATMPWSRVIKALPGLIIAADPDVQIYTCAIDECLNEHWFVGLGHAKTIIETWRQEYNHERPKKSLGGLTPAAYARQLAEAK